MKTFLALIVAAGLAACAHHPLPPVLRPVRDDVPTAPSPAPDFALQDLSGATARLSDFRGKTILLDFWATWCVPCKQSIPRYMEMQNKLRAKGFVVVGVDESESADVVSAHARRQGINYPILLDKDAGLFRKYSGRSLPSAFLIDAQGNIRGHWDGFDAATGLDVEAATYRLLGEKPRF